MSAYIVECQINALDERRKVTVAAEDSQEAQVLAAKVIRQQEASDPSVRGCIVVGVSQVSLQ